MVVVPAGAGGRGGGGIVKDTLYPPLPPKKTLFTLAITARCLWTSSIPSTSSFASHLPPPPFAPARLLREVTTDPAETWLAISCTRQCGYVE